MERKESRDEGWGQGGAEGQRAGGRGTTRRESQKMEEENGSRRGKIGDWEAERERKGSGTEKKSRESWGEMEGDRREPHRERTGWQMVGGSIRDQKKK